MARNLDELTTVEAEQAARGGAILLLPIGAVEAHGPHLPLGTDVVLSLELARRAAPPLEAGGVEVIVAPPICYTVADFAAPFAGTISITAATATALVAEVCLSLQRHGFARVCLVNNHLDPGHLEALRAAARLVVERGGKAVALPDPTEKRWAMTLGREFRRGECHAGSYETSLVMAARPELVRGEIARGLETVPINLVQAMKDGARDFIAAGATRAYFGDPSRASVVEGDELYERLVEMVVTVVRELG